jgi:hypothetical protein
MRPRLLVTGGAFQPQVALEDGLRATVGWYIQHSAAHNVTKLGYSVTGSVKDTTL